MDRRNLRKLALGGALAVALAAALAAYFVYRTPAPPGRPEPGLERGLSSPYAAPEFAGIAEWINSPPLAMQALRGKVVLLDFWTYACIDCVRALPYTVEWDRKYRDRGLVVIGVHAPEFEFEKDPAGVRAAIAREGIRYAVALDNHLDTWSRYASRTWPAHYLVDRGGRVVYIHFGEGGYDITEHNIRYLLGLGAALAPRYPPPHARRPVPGRTFKSCDSCPAMVVIPPGSFDMGQPPLTHRVAIRHSYAIGRYEVTQAEWRAVMGSDPAHFQGAERPVEQVNWSDAQEFLRRLSRKTGRPYRLPTEAEWEYACRAGAQQEYCGSDIAEPVAWYGAFGDAGGNSGRTTHPVGAKQPNAFGLYDMSGNVWEWVADPWHNGYAGAPADGSVWPGDPARHVIRGGSWGDYPLLARAGFRVWAGTAKHSSDLGFRVAMSLPREPDRRSQH